MAVDVKRLNYIGSKFRLLDWITDSILAHTGWTSLEGKRIADLFAGTGIVSHHFRTCGSVVLSNDAELYSSIITHAFTRSVYTPLCRTTIDLLQAELDNNPPLDTVGYVTTHYSPYGSCERQFFTVKNAQRIDYLRHRIEELRPTLDPDAYAFLVASLLVSADAVSNVPAVYGCYLKSYKPKALQTLTLAPIHTDTTPPQPGSSTTHRDVLEETLLEQIQTDLVYLDPPYNSRQYSKNYFPLNIIAETPNQLESQPPLKGKTGIPTDCYLSPFCRKRKTVEEAFTKLFRSLQTEWIFMSYNSEATIARERILELMGEFGTATVIERDYKRFKSFQCNRDKDIREYLFCLHKNKI